MQRAGSTVVPGLGGGLQVRPPSGRSLACAVSRARSSRARTARAARGVSCGSAGVKVTSITSAPADSAAGAAGRGRAARDGSTVYAALQSPAVAPPRRRRTGRPGGMPRQGARPDLTSRAEWSADRPPPVPPPGGGPARAADRRGVRGQPMSDPGGE